MLRNLPWIVDGATDCIQQFIRTRKEQNQPLRALEFGSGASTIWFAQQVSYLVSFEHDLQWHAAVKNVLRALGCTTACLRRHDLPYWHLVDSYSDDEFDIVFVDGRDRVKCVERAMRVLKPGGLLALDNTERVGNSDAPGRYFDVLACTRGWPCIHFEQATADRTGWKAPHRWITTVWHKPTSDTPTFYTTTGNRL